MDASAEGLDHVAIIVRSIDASLGYYRDHLGLAVVSDERLPEIGVRLAYLDAKGTLLQLVEPIADGPLMTHLIEHGEGLHHLCFAVDDAPTAADRLDEPATRRFNRLPDGRRAGFLSHRPNNVRLELIDKAAVAAPATEGKADHGSA